MPYHNIYIPRVRTPSFLISSEIPAQMTVLQQAQLYVDQLRREASKQRINVSEAITDMKVDKPCSVGFFSQLSFRSLLPRPNLMIAY